MFTTLALTAAATLGSLVALTDCGSSSNSCGGPGDVAASVGVLGYAIYLLGMQVVAAILRADDSPTQT